MIIVFWATAGLLLYAHVVYPALMWLVSRGISRSSTETSTHLPSVTLIIPAHNEELVLSAKLINTLALDYPRDRLEVLVVSDGSNDRTAEIASGFAVAGVRLLELSRNLGKSSALNAGVAGSTGEVLCMCDANVIFRPDALRRMVARLSDPEIGAVSGDVRIASEESDFGFGEARYYSIERPIQLGESRIGSMIGVDGGMYLVRRELFKTLPPDTLLDDFVTSMQVLRQRKRIVYEPAAIATENGTPTWRQEFHRRVRVKRGALQTMRRGLWPPLSRPVEVWQYLSHKPLRWFGPIWLMLHLLSSAALWQTGWIYGAAFVAQIVFYAAATLAWISPAIRRIRPFGLAFYFTMSHVAMLVGLIKGVFCTPTGVWERTSRAPITDESQRPELAAREPVSDDARLASPVNFISATPSTN